MRLFKITVLAALLAAGAHAQTSSSAENMSAQPAGGAPQSPLQEAQPQTDNPRPAANPAAFNAQDAGGSLGQDQELGEIRLMTRYTELGGDTTRSFRVEGSNNVAEFNYFMDRRFLVTRRFQALSMYRGTDDRSVDPERNSLQKAYLRIYGPRDEYIAGDTLVNFSRLSFNQNIKGVSLAGMPADDWKVSFAGGVFIDRYGSLWKELPGRPFRATVLGARIERKLLKDSTVGLNFSSSADDVDSLPLTTVAQPADNRIVSLDGRWLFAPGLRIESEFGYSFTDFDKRVENCPPAAGSPDTDFRACDSRSPQGGLGYQGDWGGRVEGSWRVHKWNLRGSYARYQPNFASINARQIADLQDFIFRSSYDLTDWLAVDGTIRRSNNNLKEQLESQLTLWGPEAKLIFHDLGLYPRGVFEVGYRHRDVNGSNNTANRYVRMPYVEVTVPVRSTFLSIGYERRQARDLVVPGQSSNTDRFYGSLRSVFDLGNWQVNPVLRLELERQGHRPRLPQAGVPSLLELQLDRDSNRLTTASVLVEAPKWFIFEAAFRNSSATIFGPAGYRRPAYRGAATYKFANNENTLFVFGFERNSNIYLASPSYDERLWSGTLIYKFGRGRR